MAASAHGARDDGGITCATRRALGLTAREGRAMFGIARGIGRSIAEATHMTARRVMELRVPRAVAMVAALTAFAAPARSQVTRDDYARAERMLLWNAAALVRNASVRPHWIHGSDRFWYRRETADGAEFVVVDPRAVRGGRRSTTRASPRRSRVPPTRLGRRSNSRSIPSPSWTPRVRSRWTPRGRAGAASCGTCGILRCPTRARGLALWPAIR